MQLAQKRGDECAARLEQQEKELLQSTEEFKLKMEDLRHKTEEQIKAVLKETRYPPKKKGYLVYNWANISFKTPLFTVTP
jgi:hypothetical protein